MSTTAHARARPADPQSGPAQGKPGFFHFNMQWVRADPGRITALGLSHYIRRADGRTGEHERAAIRDGSEREPSVSRVSDYVARRERGREDELGAYVLIGRGLPVTTGAQLARLLDARERKKDRSYRLYGGQLPRVATHLIASLPYGTTSEQAEVVVNSFARDVSDRLHVPIEAVVHVKAGRPDHVHAVIGTRVVENGRLGRKQRALDAVSEKADGHAIDVGGRYVGNTLEWMRSEWARRTREISGDEAIDHRSYARRGVALQPVTHVARTEIEYERRRGTTTWRERRRRELAARHGAASVRQPGVSAGTGMDQAVAAERSATDHASVEQHAVPLSAELAKSGAVEADATTNQDPARAVADPPGFDALGEADAPPSRLQLPDRWPDANHAPGPPQLSVAEVRRRVDALFDVFVAPKTPAKRQATGGNAAAWLADLLGLDVPDAVLAAVLRQRTPDRSRDGDRAPGSPRPGDDLRPLPRRPEASSAPGPGDGTAPASRGPTNLQVSRPQVEPARMAPGTRPSEMPGVASPLPSQVSAASPQTSTGRLPTRFSGVADEGALTGRLDGRGTDKAVANPGAPAASHAGRRALPDAALRLPPGPPVHSDRAGPEASSRSRVDGQPKADRPAVPHPDLPYAIGMFTVLHQRRRLTAGRVAELGAWVKMDRTAFEAAARATVAVKRDDAGGPYQLPQLPSQPLPQHLALCWQRWEDEDNEARRARRARAREQAPSPEQAPPNATTREPAPPVYAPAKPQAPPAALAGMVGADRRSPVGSDGTDTDSARQLTGRSTAPAPGSSTVVPGAPSSGAAERAGSGNTPDAAVSPDALERALVKAFIADVRSAARRGGRTPTPTELEHGVALRLRVTGRDRGEVDALLAPFAAKANVPGGRERIVQAIAHAFSDDTTRRLRTRTSFIDSIQALEVRTEAQLFRDLRRQAMDGFRRDLDAVWVERRMRADEAARRHARWLNLLRGLRWRTERVRLRSDLVVAILAALVELVVLWPLIARQQAAATAERRAIDEAAERASSELKRLRSEWRAHVGARALRPDQPCNDQVTARTPLFGRRAPAVVRRGQGKA